jgi:hypothetical protein
VHQDGNLTNGLQTIVRHLAAFGWLRFAATDKRYRTKVNDTARQRGEKPYGVMVRSFFGKTACGVWLGPRFCLPIECVGFGGVEGITGKGKVVCSSSN